MYVARQDKKCDFSCFNIHLFPKRKLRTVVALITIIQAKASREVWENFATNHRVIPKWLGLNPYIIVISNGPEVK